MHAIGSPEGVTLLEFEPERQEKQQVAQEQEVQAEGGVNVEDLPECPCRVHKPGSPMGLLSNKSSAQQMTLQQRATPGPAQIPNDRPEE